MYIFYSCIYIYTHIYLKAEAFKAPNFLVFCARSGGGEKMKIIILVQQLQIKVPGDLPAKKKKGY